MGLASVSLLHQEAETAAVSPGILWLLLKVNLQGTKIRIHIKVDSLSLPATKKLDVSRHPIFKVILRREKVHFEADKV